jgi:SAM-dependent methyltransferase
MAKVFTTEITSDNIPSDNPIHQRLLRPYVLVKDWIVGDVLEVGCGEGRGIDLLLEKAKSYTAIDKIEPVVKRLQEKYLNAKFLSGNIPPLTPFADNSFDSVVSFQVIEHIEDDHLFLKEINRVLRSGGTAWITTPNRPLSLSRNPWHIREYTAAELTDLAKKYFTKVDMKGIAGNEKVMQYHDRNKKSVERLMRWDILDLQHKLPASLLRIPYEMMNRLNRNKLQGQADELVASIKQDDYVFSSDAVASLDLFLIVKK